MSWIITDRATGRAVMETFKAATAARVNLDRYRVQEAGAYLAELNARHKAERSAADGSPETMPE